MQRGIARVAAPPPPPPRVRVELVVLLAARRRKIPAVLLGYWQQTGQSYGAPVVADLGAANRVQTLQRLVAQARTSLLGLGVAA